MPWKGNPRDEIEIKGPRHFIETEVNGIGERVEMRIKQGLSRCQRVGFRQFFPIAAETYDI